jgi:hypothetical protein
MLAQRIARQGVLTGSEFIGNGAYPPPRRCSVPAAMTGLGHEDPFPPRWLNVRCVIRHGTFAETNGNGRDAPLPAVRRTVIEPRGLTLAALHDTGGGWPGSAGGERPNTIFANGFRYTSGASRIGRIAQGRLVIGQYQVG